MGMVEQAVAVAVCFGFSAADWGGWACIGFVPPDDGAVAAGGQVFQEIYDKEVRIYPVADVLPRAALFSAVDVPESEVLARLKAPDFEPEKRVILSRESVPIQDIAALGTLENAQSGSTAKAARIGVCRSQYVRIEAEAEGPSLLMLNDTVYLGWRA